MTAQWVQDYVTDPSYGIGLTPDDTEFQAAKIYLGKPGVSLDVEKPPAKHDYSDYLLALWAARRGGPSFVPDIWANVNTMKPKEAINAALPGGFESTWADFALSNWNQGPVKDYKTWDDLATGAALTDSGSVPLNTPQSPTIEVNHLAAEYFSLGVDPKATELEVENDLAGDPHAKLRAIVEYTDWQPQDHRPLHQGEDRDLHRGRQQAGHVGGPRLLQRAHDGSEDFHAHGDREGPVRVPERDRPAGCRAAVPGTGRARGAGV